jgi:putative copper export protein
MTLLFLLKIVHIAAASVWIGGGLSAAPDIRRTLSLGQPHAGELMPRLRGVANLMNFSALITLVSGLVIVFAIGGFARVPHRIHAGLALTLLAIVVGRWMIRPVIGDIARATRGPVAGAELDRIVGRFRRAVGVEHALRLAVLVLMVYPFSF